MNYSGLNLLFSQDFKFGPLTQRRKFTSFSRFGSIFFFLRQRRLGTGVLIIQFKGLGIYISLNVFRWVKRLALANIFEVRREAENTRDACSPGSNTIFTLIHGVIFYIDSFLNSAYLRLCLQTRDCCCSAYYFLCLRTEPLSLTFAKVPVVKIIFRINLLDLMVLYHALFLWEVQVVESWFDVLTMTLHPSQDSCCLQSTVICFFPKAGL